MTQTVWLVRTTRKSSPCCYFGGFDYANDPILSSRENAVKFGNRESAVHCARVAFKGYALLESIQEKAACKKMKPLSYKEEEQKEHQEIMRRHRSGIRARNLERALAPGRLRVRMDTWRFSLED